MLKFNELFFYKILLEINNFPKYQHYIVMFTYWHTIQDTVDSSRNTSLADWYLGNYFFPPNKCRILE